MVSFICVFGVVTKTREVSEMKFGREPLEEDEEWKNCFSCSLAETCPISFTVEPKECKDFKSEKGEGRVKK